MEPPPARKPEGRLMAAGAILTLWIVLYLLQQGGETLLTLLNLRHGARHPRPPAELEEVLDTATVARMHDYQRARSRLGLVRRALVAAVTVAVVTGGGLGALDRVLAGWLSARGIASPLLAGAAFVALLAVASTLLTLGIRLYGQFVIEERFGFNRMTVATFFFDVLKSLLLTLVLGVPLLLGLFWFMAETGDFWWIWAFCFVAAFQLLVNYLYQPLIAPLFNKFRPLAEGTLKERLVTLAERLRFRVKSVLVMDGSRRSGHSNAYFAGFGGAKRIVLFDTLLGTLDEPQVEAVLAHEIGHEKRRHVLKHVALSLLLTLLGLWLISVLLHQPALFAAFGFHAAGAGAGAGQPSSHAALVILSLLWGPATFFLQPAANAWIRRHEYEADRYAARATGGAGALAGALITLSRDNLSNPHPHPWYSAYHYTHPTLAERLRALHRYAATR
ncbi:MAG: M48 family metallopeptidase [Spirochaetaceae bacterium]|nr:M48 family metallopeptidase [Spirochaetaceae bacterium]